LRKRSNEAKKGKKEASNPFVSSEAKGRQGKKEASNTFVSSAITSICTYNVGGDGEDQKWKQLRV
jgi:hypothetical protein